MSPLLDVEQDYYAVLGVSPEADRDEIRKAHRRLAREYHPDTGRGDTTAFRLMQQAYEVLSNPALRKAYDRQRHSRGLMSGAPIRLDLLLSRTEMPALDARQRLYLMLDVRGNGSSTSDGKPLNLALVIDCSTSMQGRRMRNVRLATRELIDSLSGRDRLAIIKFNDRAEVVVDSSLVRDGVKFQSGVAHLHAAGGTEILKGLLAGLRAVRHHARPDALNHVILLTDGHTYGDEELALAEARQAAAEGIGISAVGIGSDWNDLFLDRLARGGQGICDYVRTPDHLQTILHQQVRGLSTVSLQDLRLHVNHAAYVEVDSAARVAPYMEELEIRSGELISLPSVGDETSTLLLELLVHQPDIGEYRLARLSLEARPVSSRSKVRVRQDVVVGFVTERPKPVDAEVPMRMISVLSRLAVFRLQERAWTALEKGEADKATHLLESAATRLFDLGHRELARAAMLEARRVSVGGEPSPQGRKDVRYGTRSLALDPGGRAGAAR